MADALEKLTESSGSSQIEVALSLLRKRKWLIVGLTLVATGATAFLVSKQPKRYEAVASIVIELSVPQYLGNDFRDVVEVEPSWWHSRETLETEFRTLRSYSQAVSVAHALCDRTFAGGPALRAILPDTGCKEIADYSRAAPRLQQMLRVSPLKDSRIVELAAISENAEFAALVANTAAQVYADRNLERRLAHSAGAATWLGDEYNQLLSELRAAEQSLISFKQKNNIVAVSLEDSQNELSTRREKLADALSNIEVKLIGLRTNRDELGKLKATDPIAELTPGLSENPVAQKLKELYIDEYGKLIATQGKYLDKHPAVVAQEARLNLIKRDLAREVDIARKTLDLQYAIATKQEVDLKSALDQATKESIRVEAKTSEYHRLKRDLDRLVKLADQVGGRERETTLASQLKTNNVRVLDRARTPQEPVSPNVPKAVGLAAAASLLLSLALAFLLEALDTSVKTQDDVERTVGITFLGLIPQISAAPQVAAEDGASDGPPSRSRDFYVLTNPNSAVAECCRAIRTNLLFMSPDKPAKTLLVTSAGPEEGKTTVAINLATTLAQSGLRVLIVDTDMRRPRIHKAFGIPSTSEGISSAIVAEADLSSSIRSSGIENLSVLPCGPCPPNPAELFHAERFRQIVKELAGAFDRVIFDSPPIGAVTDAAILASLTDGTVLVAKGGRTSKEALRKARKQITIDPKVNLLGCILNDLTLSKQREYGYYYYYSRYGYYAQSGAPETGAATPSS